jgi:ubiquinone biosynthesis protein
MAFRIKELTRTGKNVKRLAPMLVVLARHGFGHLVHRLGLLHYLPASLRAKARPKLMGEPSMPEGLSMARSLREVLEEWGPTAVKFGQMLSTRPDLLPEPYLRELRKLTDDVPPFPGAEAHLMVETSLGKPMPELFRRFDDVPVAAGSIGQVHEAELPDGAKVVVKVKRPGIDDIIHTDLELMEMIAVPLLEMIEELRPLQPRAAVREFRRGILRELDFVTEASATEKIGADLDDFENLVIPDVHWSHTNSNILTLKRLTGTRLSDPDAIAALTVDRREAADTLAHAFFTQFFKTGLFHADPHAGNIFVTPTGKIGLLDFGLVGRLDAQLRATLAGSMIALQRGDIEAVTEVYVEIGVVGEDTDLDAFKTEIHELLDKYYGVPLSRLDLSRCFADAMETARRHDVILPRNLVLFAKSFNMMIMACMQVCPEFDVAASARPFARKLLLARFHPRRVSQEALAGLWQASTALQRLPRQMRTFSRKLLQGRLQFNIEHRVEAFDRFAHEIDRATNRVAFSIIVSAVVIGSALLLHARIRPHLDDILPGPVGHFVATYMPQTSVLGLAGFLFAGILGLLLAFAIWRHGRL